MLTHVRIVEIYDLRYATFFQLMKEKLTVEQYNAREQSKTRTRTNNNILFLFLSRSENNLSICVIEI